MTELRGGALPLWRSVQQNRWLVFIVAPLLILAGIGGYLLHGNHEPGDKALPTTMPLPADATLMRFEHFVSEQTFNWYYAVPRMDNDAVSAYYQARLPHLGWQCIMTMKSLNNTLYGKQFTASNIYLTALKARTYLQLSTAGGDYGAYLLQDDLPDAAVALKISIEPAQHPTCPATPTPSST